MKSVLKRGITAFLALALVIGVFAGCSRTSSEIADYASTVVATYGDENIYLDEANFYARLQQYYSEALYSAYYGDNFWTMEVSEGKTLEETTKENVMASILQTRVLMDHADEYEVSLTDEDKEKVREAASTFFTENDESLKEAANVSDEQLYAILEKNALAMKVWAAVVADVDTEVSDEEARQVSIEYILVSEDEENPEQCQKAAAELVERLNNGEEIDVLADENDSYTVFSGTYSKNEEGATGLAGVAATMATGENTTCYVEGTGAYAIHCVTDFDEEATETEKQTIIQERQADRFELVYSSWKPDMKEFTVVDDVWAQITFEGNPVYVAETSTETPEETEGETETEADTQEESQAPSQEETESPEASSEETE